MNQTDKPILYMLQNVERLGHILFEPFYAFNAAHNPPGSVVFGYPEGHNGGNPAVRRIVERYYRLQPVKNFMDVWWGRAKLNYADGSPVRLARWDHDYLNLFVDKVVNQKKPPFFFELNEEEIAEGQKFQESIGIPLDEPFICVHNREPGFLPDQNYHRHRDSDIENFLPAIDYLLDEGYWVVRLGDPTMKPIPMKTRKLLDLPFMEHKHGLGDVWLSIKCVMFLGTSSGPLNIPKVFKNGPPRILTNWVHWPWPTFNRQERYIPKITRVPRQGNRMMTLDEKMFSWDKFWVTDAYDRAGLTNECSRPEDILDVTIETLEDIRAGRPIDLENPNQQKYYALANKWHKAKTLIGTWEPCIFGSPIGNRFLAKYPEFLETSIS